MAWNSIALNFQSRRVSNKLNEEQLIKNKGGEGMGTPSQQR